MLQQSNTDYTPNVHTPMNFEQNVDENEAGVSAEEARLGILKKI